MASTSGKDLFDELFGDDDFQSDNSGETSVAPGPAYAQDSTSNISDAFVFNQQASAFNAGLDLGLDLGLADTLSSSLDVFSLKSPIQPALAVPTGPMQLPVQMPASGLFEMPPMTSVMVGASHYLPTVFPAAALLPPVGFMPQSVPSLNPFGLGQLPTMNMMAPFANCTMPAANMVPSLAGPSDANMAIDSDPSDDDFPQMRLVRPVHQPDLSVYSPLAAPLPSWGPLVNGRPLFEYTAEGEFESRLTFTAAQLRYYFANIAGQGRTLTLWIQNTPAASRARYASAVSACCRYARCPSRSNHILKGFFRVALDEFGDETGKTRDPFRNAGYMHLFCLEECFELGSLVETAGLNIDVRKFRHESNPMSLARDHAGLKQVVLDHIASAPLFNTGLEHGEDAIVLARPGMPRAQKLWFKLTSVNLAMEPLSRARMRNGRNGCSIDKHRGDVALYSRMKQAVTRLKQKQAARPRTVGLVLQGAGQGMY